jgi:signal transduction histidine kinase
VKVVLSRLLSFLILIVFIVGLYALTVATLAIFTEMPDIWLSVIASIAIAASFEPVRIRVQRWTNRLVLGSRASPYEVLSDLSKTLAKAESVEGLLDQTAKRMADGTGADRAAVWLAEGARYRVVGVWPKGTTPDVVDSWQELPGYVTPIESEGTTQGALSVEKRRNDPITPNEEALLDDLAGSAASVLRNLALQAELLTTAEELEASRRRMVEAQDTERRKMERQLDEGAQQLVVSLKVKLNVAARMARADGDDALADMLETMDGEARAAIDQIRLLARGLYPPLLETRGLAPAVRSIADLAAAPVVIETTVEDRFPLETEATVFFCISEAITNAAKHAPGATIHVGISRSGERLDFEVRDEGPGFDRASSKLGSGLQNMADRVEASGGRLVVSSRPGQGTSVKGWVPVAHDSAVLQPALQ